MEAVAIEIEEIAVVLDIIVSEKQTLKEDLVRAIKIQILIKTFFQNNLNLY